MRPRVTALQFFYRFMKSLLVGDAEQRQYGVLSQHCQQLRANWFCKYAVCSYSPRLVSRIICTLLSLIIANFLCQIVVLVSLAVWQIIIQFRQNILNCGIWPYKQNCMYGKNSWYCMYSGASFLVYGTATHCTNQAEIFSRLQVYFLCKILPFGIDGIGILRPDADSYVALHLPSGWATFGNPMSRPSVDQRSMRVNVI